MTGIIEEAEEDLGIIPKPVPVKVGGTVSVGHDVNTQAQGADYGAYMTYVTAASGDVARPILPYDPFRHAARLIVSSLVNPVTGVPGVWVGTQAQCQANPPVGGWIPVGTQLLVEHNQAVWLVGDQAFSLKVTVAVERWDNRSA